MINILSAICSEENLEKLDNQIFDGSNFSARPLVLSETSYIITIILVH